MTANESSPAQERWWVAPYFFVADVEAAANQYRDVLGFQYNRFWGEGPNFCMVHRAGITIMLSLTQQPGAVRPNRMNDEEGGAWDAYIWIPNADALHTEFLAKGAKIVRGLCDQEYGCRDFEVEDRDGYRLCFGQDVS
jgi:predicted enzyme related to lactoylglutathione lyase